MVSNERVMNVIIVFLLIGLNLILLGLVTKIVWLGWIGALITIIYTISFLWERANKDLKELNDEY